jgi:serine/threonine protein kinase
MFEEQGRDFWHKWRMSNILQVSGIKDVRFLDLLAGMLDPNPEWRMTVREVLGHPLLAHLMPFGPPPALPAMNGLEGADKEDIPPPRVNSVDAQIEVLLTHELAKSAAASTKATAKTPAVPAASNRKRKR